MFGGPGWTWVRAQGALRDAAAKVAEGGQFFTRGIRLLGSDVNSAAVLFYRAAAGASLKPREARARCRPLAALLWRFLEPAQETLMTEVVYCSLTEQSHLRVLCVGPCLMLSQHGFSR